MNLWISLVAPLLFLSFLFKYFQYLSHKDGKDKATTVIILTIIQLSLQSWLIIGYNQITNPVFWTTIAGFTILFNYMQTSFDARELEPSISKESSLGLTWLFQAIAILSLYLYYFL